MALIPNDGFYPFSMDDMKVLMTYDDGNVVYLGRALPGTATSVAQWQIRKFTYDDDKNVTKIEFASGSSKYEYEWDEVENYEYS